MRGAEDAGATGAKGAGGWRLLAAGQGGYFLATGLWPLLHMPSFLVVTGPKTDLWLVRLVGAMVGVVGLALVEAAVRRRLDRSMVIIGIGLPVVLGGFDVVFVLRGTIPPVYLLDAVAQAVIVSWWLWVVGRKRTRPGSNPAASELR